MMKEVYLTMSDSRKKWYWKVGTGGLVVLASLAAGLFGLLLLYVWANLLVMIEFKR